MSIEKIKKYIREPINSLTHAIGVLLAITGLVVLLYEAVMMDSVSQIVAFSIFGASMILLYSASALYHGLPVKEKTLLLFKKLDHAMIYVLIAGTYTPICLLVLQNQWKWGVLITVWSLAAVGIIKKFLSMQTPRWTSTLLYLSMGWMGVFLIPSLYQKLPFAFSAWILAGGLAYTIGAVIYGLKKPNFIPGWLGHHEIWHLFVMAGTFAHFWAFYDYLVFFHG